LNHRCNTRKLLKKQAADNQVFVGLAANSWSMGRYQSRPQISFGDAESMLSIRPVSQDSLWYRMREMGDRLLPNSLYDLSLPQIGWCAGRLPRAQ
jgi:hypothetical protein